MRSASFLILYLLTTKLAAQEKTIFDKIKFEEHVRTLSSDDFQGRKPGTIGEEKTIRYLADEFKKAGATPGNGNSYFQQMSLIDIRPQTDSVMIVKSNSSELRLKKLNDFVLWTQSTEAELKFNNEELIFAGYGITAPEYGWDDYANLDVRGKIVLVQSFEPIVSVNGKELFKGEEKTWHSHWLNKIEEAARHGAKGCLMINGSNPGQYEARVNSLVKGRMFIDDTNKSKNVCSIIGFISDPAALKILELAGRSSSILKDISTFGFRGFPLNVSISVSMRTKVTRLISNNVLAKIEGSKRPGEVVIATAHWDHLGIGLPDQKGDSIYNGAHDNAAGVSLLLEFARRLASIEKPERSILFIATTCEENGLLGAHWYARHPVYPLYKTVANINFDGFNSFGQTRDILVPGIGQNELEDLLQEQALLQKRYVNFKYKDTQAYFFRSDQLPFALAGVPAIFPLNYGDEFLLSEKSEYFKQQILNFQAQGYHKPSDEFSSDWDVEGGLLSSEPFFGLLKKLAYSNIWPKWKEGSEFKIVREKSMEASLGTR